MLTVPKLRWTPKPALLAAVTRVVADHFAHGGQLHDLAMTAERLPPQADLRATLDDVVKLGLTLDQVWLLLAIRIAARKDVSRHAELATIAQRLIANVSSALGVAANGIFDKHLAGDAMKGVTFVNRRERLDQRS